MKQSFTAGLLACFVAVVLWGAQLPIAKDTFSLLDPVTTTVIRYAVATLLLVPV
jgi:drug/metabolite transporter (DMT)-like permease